MTSVPELSGPATSGKVRDVYQPADPQSGDQLLIVASDRVSAYDHVLETAIPDKGRVLTAMSMWWFRMLAPRGRRPNHVLSVDVRMRCWAGR